jgi:hypothetical protein
MGSGSPSLTFQGTFLGRARGEEWADGKTAAAPS